MDSLLQQTFNVVGCGRLGTTIGALWQAQSSLQLQAIYSRRPDSLETAQRWLAPQLTSTQLEDLPAADIWLLSCPDGAIAQLAQQLAASPTLFAGCTVLHCSGAHSSDLLQPLRQRGALIASVHPVHSFANPALSIEQFAGSYAAMEGDDAALAQLEPIWQAIGAKTFRIETPQKSLYHAAASIACNYFVSLIAESVKCYELAGIEQSAALQLLQPILQNTLANVCELGPAAALTGPIARGDDQVTRQHLDALATDSPTTLPLYKILGLATLELASPNVSEDAQIKLKQLMETPDP